MAVHTVSASDFKARCLDILDRLARRELQRVVVTKRGRAVAVLIPPDEGATALESLHGFMRGSVVVPDSIDLTEPVLDGPFDAERGTLHG